MKISCEVIKDLLPLYYDSVCSKKSKEAVEAHLTECEVCKAELLEMRESMQFNVIGRNLSEAEELQKLSKKWRKGRMRSFLKGAVIAAIVIVLAIVLVSIFFSIRITVV